MLKPKLIEVKIKQETMRIRNQKNSSNILVLNSDFLPVNVTTFKKAFKLIYKGKAEIVEKGDNEAITFRKNYNKPSIIRLVKYVNIPYRKVILSRENVFKRDEYRCAYCFASKNLTIDHVFPKSKGGSNDWENLITCCFDCNSKKGDKTLEQAGLKLLFQPFKPSPFYFMYSSYKDEHKWHPYLMF